MTVDAALAVLEADVRAHGSGYEKERLLRTVSRAPLSTGQHARALGVLQAAVRRGRRRELRQLGRLARALGDGARAWLVSATRDPDDGVARRALWLLWTFGDVRTDDLDQTRVRALVLSACSRRDVVESQHAWLEQLARRVHDPAWVQGCVARALEDGNPAALRALTVLPRVRLDGHERRLLAGRVAAEVGRGRSDLPLHDLARLLDRPLLAEALGALAAADDGSRAARLAAQVLAEAPAHGAQRARRPGRTEVVRPTGEEIVDSPSDAGPGG